LYRYVEESLFAKLEGHRPGPGPGTVSLSRTSSSSAEGASCAARTGAGGTSGSYANARSPRQRECGSRCVLRPDSLFAAFWAVWIAFLTLTYVALLEPVLIAFDAPLRMRGPPWHWSAILDFLGGVTFLFDIAVTFNTGVIVSSKVLGRVVTIPGCQIGNVCMVHTTRLSSIEPCFDLQSNVLVKSANPSAGPPQARDEARGHRPRVPPRDVHVRRPGGGAPPRAVRAVALR
jgi:hypothetical protein